MTAAAAAWVAVLNVVVIAGATHDGAGAVAEAAAFALVAAAVAVVAARAAVVRALRRPERLPPPPAQDQVDDPLSWARKRRFGAGG